MKKNIFLTSDIVKEILLNDNNINQNRRVIRKKEIIQLLDKNFNKNKNKVIKKYAKYHINDILNVKEPVKIKNIDKNINKYVIEYLADGKFNLFPISEKIKNKKWFKLNKGIPYGCLKEHSRLFLKITDVKIQKLQDITLTDIIKTGIKIDYTLSTISKDIQKVDEKMYYNSFIKVWDSLLNKNYKWKNNPYVFVYYFKKIEKF